MAGTEGVGDLYISQKSSTVQLYQLHHRECEHTVQMIQLDLNVNIAGYRIHSVANSRAVGGGFFWVYYIRRCAYY